MVRGGLFLIQIENENNRILTKKVLDKSQEGT